MKAQWYWLCAFLHERYCIRYWEQVAQNERWFALLIELTEGNQHD